MSELTLLIFRIGFLIALWVFVFFVLFVIRTDLFGTRVKKMPAVKASTGKPEDVFLTSASARTSPNVKSASNTATSHARSLVIIAGPNEGTSLALVGEAISIGRSSDSTVVIRDDYTSTHHARIENRSGTWFVNDMGSTNGTFVNGKKITDPVQLTPGTTVTIGGTTFEARG